MIYHSLMLYISLILLWCHTYVSSHPALGCLVLFSGICGHLHTQGKGKEEKPSFCPWRARVLLVLTDNVEMREPQPHPVKKRSLSPTCFSFYFSFPHFFPDKLSCCWRCSQTFYVIEDDFQPLISLPSHSKSWDYKYIQPSLVSTVIRIQTKALHIRQAPYQLSLFQATAQSFLLQSWWKFRPMWPWPACVTIEQHVSF